MNVWHEINSAKDIDYLFEFYGGFHDSCIKELRYASGAMVTADRAMFFGKSQDRQVDIVFQSQWNPNEIEMRFVGMRRMNITGWQSNYLCEIFGCHLAFHNDLIAGLDDDLIVWSDNSGFNPKQLLDRQILSEPGVSFIIAEKLSWREVHIG